jgi:hypothetical protein
MLLLTLFLVFTIVKVDAGTVEAIHIEIKDHTIPSIVQLHQSTHVGIIVKGPILLLDYSKQLLLLGRDDIDVGTRLCSTTHDEMVNILQVLLILTHGAIKESVACAQPISTRMFVQIGAGIRGIVQQMRIHRAGIVETLRTYIFAATFDGIGLTQQRMRCSSNFLFFKQNICLRRCIIVY